jgi:hypothetical protein
LKTINPNALAQIRQLTARRDGHARTLGIAFVEMEIATSKAIAEQKPDVLYAAKVEFDGYRQRYMGKIVADCKRQEDIGKSAMRALGINPDGRTNYTIDLATGAVKVLRNGAWEDVQ